MGMEYVIKVMEGKIHGNRRWICQLPKAEALGQLTGMATRQRKRLGKGVSHLLPDSWQENAYWKKRFEEFAMARDIFERIGKYGEGEGSREQCDFKHSRCMVVRSKEPVDKRRRKYTYIVYETPEGRTVYDYRGEYLSMQKKMGKLLADGEVRTWKKHERQVEVEDKTYAYWKFWEVSGIVLAGKKCYEWEVREPDIDPWSIKAERTLEEVLAASEGQWTMVQDPRDCVMADWSCVSIPCEGIAKRRLGMPNGVTSKIWVADEIVLVAKEARNVAADFLLWELEYGRATNRGMLMMERDPEQVVKERIEREATDVVFRMLEHNRAERKLAELLNRFQAGVGEGVPRRMVQGELF